MGSSLNESGHVVYEWNESGPVFGPNGELELDPDNQQCYTPTSPVYGGRSVFATCKNNCPGGELSVWYCNLETFNINSIFISVNFPVVAGEAL